MTVGLEEQEAEEAAVLRLVGVAQGIERHACGLTGYWSGSEVPLQRREHVRCQRPDRGGEQRHVYDRRLTGALASVERAGDAEGELHRGVPVAETATLVDRSLE